MVNAVVTVVNNMHISCCVLYYVDIWGIFWVLMLVLIKRTKWWPLKYVYSYRQFLFGMLFYVGEYLWAPSLRNDQSPG